MHFTLTPCGVNSLPKYIHDFSVLNISHFNFPAFHTNIEDAVLMHACTCTETFLSIKEYLIVIYNADIKAQTFLTHICTLYIHKRFLHCLTIYHEMFQSMEVPLSMIVCIRWGKNSLHISFYSSKVKISYHFTKYM